jgi:fibronectin-binding autotransporter adhesin
MTTSVFQRIRFLHFAGAAIVCAAFSVCTSATSAVVVWQGGDGANPTQNNDVTRALNWVAGTAPTTADVATFDSSVATTFNGPLNSAAVSWGGISFSAGSTTSFTFTLASQAARTLTLGSSGIVNLSSVTQSIATSGAGIVLGAAAPFTQSGSGTLSIAPAVSNGGFLLTLNGDGAGAATVSGAISGTGGLTKSGTGTWTLSGANTYGGATTISGGSLVIAAATALPAATPVTLSGGALTVGATGTFNTLGVLTLSNSSTIDFGNLIGSTALSFADSSAASWAPGTLSILNYNASGTDTLRFGTTSGGLTGGQLAQISFGGTPAQIDSQGFVSPIPEPSTYAALAGIGVFGLAIYRRRRARLSSAVAVTAAA